VSALEDGGPEGLLISQGCHQEAAQSCILEHEGANNCVLQSASASGHLVGRDCFDSSEVGRIHPEPNGSDSGPNGRNVPPTSAGALLVSARSPYTDFEYGNLLSIDDKHLQEHCSCQYRSSCHSHQASPFIRNADETISTFVSVPCGTG
jgi:hypothetical protein